MSASMWVAPPPQVVQQRYVTTSTRFLIAPVLFDSDGTLVADALIERGDAVHQWLRGARAVAAHSDDDDLLADLDHVLGLIDRHGGAQVVIER